MASNGSRKSGQAVARLTARPWALTDWNKFLFLLLASSRALLIVPGKWVLRTDWG